LNECINQTEIIYAITIPINGARKIKLTVFITGSELMESKVPACAIAAPANPPISVCDEEEGIPSHHVNRFHKIAATKPENITGSVIKFDLTVFAIVFATP
jgi:hypothetical protein